MVSIILKTLLYLLSLILISSFFIFSLHLTKYRYEKLKKTYQPDLTETVNITEDDIKNLPVPIQGYLNYVGVVGTPKVLSYQIDFDGEMQFKEGEDYYDIKAVQTSFVKPVTRLFYITSTYNHIKMYGLHAFTDKEASMKIKLLDILPVVNVSDDITRKAEIVTILNDIVLFAPHALINSDVTFEVVNNYQVKVFYTYDDHTVSAMLYFNEAYQLTNFVSNDRYAITDQGYEQIPWSTPITSYQTINGLNLVKDGAAIWHYDDRDYEYIRLHINNITYNQK